MDIPTFAIVYLDAADNIWTPYRCRVSGTPRFEREEGERKCHWLVSRGHAAIAKLVGEDGEVSIWERDANGRARRESLGSANG